MWQVERQKQQEYRMKEIIIMMIMIVIVYLNYIHYCMQNVEERNKLKWYWWWLSGADLAFFQGGGLTHANTSRFFCGYFEWRDWRVMAILRAAKRRVDFFGYFTSARSGEPNFELMFSWHLLTQWNHDNVFSSPRGGGGVKPLWGSLRQSYRKTVWVWTYYDGVFLHIKFLLGSPRGGG